MSLLRETTMDGNPSKRVGYAHFPFLDYRTWPVDYPSQDFRQILIDQKSDRYQGNIKLMPT